MAGHPRSNGSNGGGAVGAVGGEGVVVPVLPDRVDVPFVAELDGAHNPISDQRVGPIVYPDRCWSADWRAWVGLRDYTKQPWDQIAVQAWDDTQTEAEVNDLVIAARDERADALAEIVAQHEASASYFFALLTADPVLYPATNLLITYASLVGTFTVMYYKNGVATGPMPYSARPRPSQICPALRPPVPVPGHPSYPSGHSTEAHLIRYVLVEALNGQAKYQGLVTDLEVLADRVARNREIAGLHYKQDSAAGKALAYSILQLLHYVDFYTDARTKARNEWL